MPTFEDTHLRIYTMSKEIALSIKTTAANLGWTVEVSREVLRISKPINGREELVTADGEYYSILSLLPQTTAGSMWGTDCGGVGAVAALRNGMFMMHKSGGSKRVLNALAKLV